MRHKINSFFQAAINKPEIMLSLGHLIDLNCILSTQSFKKFHFSTVLQVNTKP